MARHPAVLVVVVNFRSAAYIEKLIPTLSDEAEITEVVVYDNASGGDELDRLRRLEAQHPAVRVVQGESNTGFGAGVNAAVGAAARTWDLVWVLNPDIQVRRGALAVLLAAIAGQGWGVASPLILTKADRSEERIWFAGGEVDRRRGTSSHGGVGKDARTIDWEHRSVGFITGAAPLFTRHAWQALGGFDERYFLYWEDADLSLRAQGLGITMGVAARSVVEHDQGGSTGGVGPIYCFYSQRNRLWLQPTFKDRFRVAFVTGVGGTRALFLLALQERHRTSGRFRTLAASLHGLLRGLMGPPPAPGAAARANVRA